jgi:hypothetical protein
MAMDSGHYNPPRPKEEFDSLCEWTIEHHKEKRDALHDKARKERKTTQPTQAELILGISENICEKLFHDQYQTPYAAVKSGDHTEALLMSSKRFKNYLSGAYYESYNAVPNPEAITSAISVLKYKADFKGDMIPLQLRVAECEGGNDTRNDIVTDNKTSLPTDTQNHAQNEDGNGSNDSNDTLHDSEGPDLTVYAQYVD